MADPVVLPVFPLGAVLLPHLPLTLRVFEPRYLQMLSDVVAAADTSFGVVLIERGQEVGGGDQRFGSGTVAHVADVVRGEDSIGLVAVGGDRFEVAAWLPDDPYPRAELTLREPLVWHPALESLRAETETVVRRSVAVASEFTEQRFPADVELSDDPEQACWQLAGIAPVGELDQLGLLAASSMDQLLTETRDLAAAAVDSWRMGWGAG